VEGEAEVTLVLAIGSDEGALGPREARTRSEKGEGRRVSI
jgi:hypothetical protein